MATLYASGASWNTASHWGTTSGASDGSVPTSADDLIFDSNSASMAIDVNAVCKSITSVAGFANALSQDTTRTLAVSGNITWAAGTFTGLDAAISCVDFTLSGGTWTNTSGIMTVSGNFTRTSGTFTHSNGTVNFTGTDTTLNCTSTFNVITANKTGQTNVLTLAAALTTASTITVTTGILCLCGYNITPGSTFTIASGATLRLQGVETITTTQPTFSTGSICVYNGDNVANTKTCKNWTYKNLTINDDKANKSTFKFGETHTGIEAFTVTAGTFSQSAGDYAIACSSMTVNGGTFTGGTADLNAGAFSVTSGTFTSTSGTLSETGTSFVVSGGTFTHNSGTVQIKTQNATCTGTITFYNLTLNKNNSGLNIVVTNTLTVNGTMSFTGASPGFATGTIVAKGDISISSGGLASSTGTLEISGTGAQAMTSAIASTSASFPNININKSSGTLTLSGLFGIGNNFIYTTGTVDPGTSTFDFYQSSNISGNPILYNVGVRRSNSGSVTLTGTLTSTGTLTLGDNNAAISGGTLIAQGDVVVSSAFSGGATTALTFSGTANQSYTNNGGNNVGGTVTIDKSSGTLTLQSDLTINTAGQDLTATAGTLDLAGYNVTVNDTFSIASGFTLKLKGNETIAAGIKTFNSNMTVEYYDAAVTAVVSNFETTLPNVKFFGGKTHNFTASGTFTSAGTWEVSGGTGQAILRSTSDGTKWNLNFTGTNSLGANVDVKDSDATPGNPMFVLGSASSGNNTDWFFVPIPNFKEELETIVFAGD